mmetsp:Transcript_10046/g.15303  ORF Transcript_10046/g.15303 Transcript_10046/m.15303 type:complete len:87 (+) Transcript_10046:31-291(+)
MDKYKFAIVSDLDGVIILCEDTTIHSSVPPVTALNKADVPLFFLTNNGRITEEAFIRKLNPRISQTMSSDRMMLCHTPLRDPSFVT